LIIDIGFGEKDITVRNGKEAKIVKFLGSDIWKVRFMEGNKTTVYSFKTKEIDWNGNDVEQLKRKYQ